ncbi:MAG: polysaccharide deacetylase family protein [Myxococcota bacterium]
MKQADHHRSPIDDTARSFACITVDLDSLSCYRDIHGLQPRRSDVDAAYAVGVRRLLDLFARYDIRATLFVIGHDVANPAHAELLAEAVDAGHELGNHTFSHHYDLPERTPSEIEDDIARGEDAIADVTGEGPVGYRAPGYNITSGVYAIISRRGYRYDSSVFPCPPYYGAKAAIMGLQALRGRPSRSAMTPATNLLAPIDAYRPSKTRLWRRDDEANGPIEIPMALVPGLRFPVIGTSLHLMGRLGFDLVYPLLKRAYPRLLQLEFHAIDFMDANDEGAEDLVDVQPDLRVAWSEKRALYDHVFGRVAEDYDATEPLSAAVDALYG